MVTRTAGPLTQNTGPLITDRDPGRTIGLVCACVRRCVRPSTFASNDPDVNT